MSTTIIAVDHGYGNIKTVHEIFPSGIMPCADEPAFARDKLNWAGRWYIIGEGHKEFTDDKAQDEDYDQKEELILKVNLSNSIRLNGFIPTVLFTCWWSVLYFFSKSDRLLYAERMMIIPAGP